MAEQKKNNSSKSATKKVTELKQRRGLNKVELAGAVGGAKQLLYTDEARK